MAAQFCWGHDLLPQKLTLFVLGAPNSGTLVYLVPPARSRYCASPEASIMRLKAAAKLGATASAPTQRSYKLQHYSTASVSELSAIGTTVQIVTDSHETD